MKKVSAAVLSMLLLFCVGCGSQTPEASLSFAAMYPQLSSGDRSALSPQRKDELRQSAAAVMETAEEYSEEDCSIKIQDSYVKATLQISGEWLKSQPEDWEETRAWAEELGQDLADVMREQGTKGVLHLSDKNGILLTAVDGAVVFDKFNRQKHYEEPPELDRSRIDEILESAAARRAAADAAEAAGDAPYWEDGEESVYMDGGGDTTGMENYEEIAWGEAVDAGYEFFGNYR